LDSEHFLVNGAKPRHARAPGDPTTFIKIFDLACKVVDTWASEEPWVIERFDTGRKLMAAYKVIRFNREVGGTEDEMFVVEFPSKTIIRRWPAGISGRGMAFAEGGRTVCLIASYSRKHEAPQCWDLASGEMIAELSSVNGGGPDSVSSEGSRIVLSDYRYIRGITEDSDMHQFRRRLIWDFRTGKEIASWVPDEQSFELQAKPGGPKIWKDLWQFSLSSSGKYLAEGGDAKLRLYQVIGR
jgi:hypothetical protein